MSSHPDPPVQVRHKLSVLKRQGVGFDRAWRWALESVRWPHDTGHRREWKSIMEETRWAWQATYRDEDIPGAVAFSTLADALAEMNEPQGRLRGTTKPAYLPKWEKGEEPARKDRKKAA